jgi:PAS domain S-box-containing protein
LVAHRPGPPLDTGQAVAVAVITMDAAGLVRDLNGPAEELTGYARTDAIGAPLARLIIPDRLCDAHEAGLRRLRDRGEAPLLDHRVQVPLLRRDGTEILVELVITRASADIFTGLIRPLAEPSALPAELHLSESFHRTLVEQAPFLITVVDADGRERWHSAGQPGPGAGARFTDRIHPADRELAQQALKHATTGRPAEPVELRIATTDDAWRVVSFLTVDLSDDPAVRGTVCYGQDITRARAAEQQARVEAARMNTLIESLGVGVLLQDSDGHVVLSNAAFVEMFALGLGPERLRGTPLRADSGRYADRVAAARRTDEAVSRGRPAIGQEFALTDGRVVERDYMPITLDGTTLGHLWVFRDVTAQADVRRGLEERNRILTELSALKTEFVSVVSHELRTPLTSIATFAGMVDDGDLDPADRHHAVDAIRRNADRMRALVADLVLLAKLESGEIVLGNDAVDFAELVRQACTEVPAEHLHLAIHGDDGGEGEGPTVLGDRDLLRQAVGTAVGVVASARDGEAPVVVDAAVRPGSSQWTLTVRTPTAERSSAERLLSTRLPHPDVPGECRTGALALMLTRAIATRHGGDLVTAVDGPDIAVTLRLPFA